MRDYPYQGTARPSVILRHYSHVFEKEADAMDEILERNRQLDTQKIHDMRAPSIYELAVKVQEYVASIVGDANLASALDYLLLDDDTQHLFSQFGARHVTNLTEAERSRKTSIGCRSDYLTFATTLMCKGDTDSKNVTK
jgi:hypothetical protein